MIHLLLKPALVLTALLGLAITVIHAVPYDDGQARAFLTAPENCTGSCLLGIRPGTTTVRQALAHLRMHRWVGSAQLDAAGAGYGQITWLWSGQQPDLIDDTHPGRITFYWDRDENHRRSLDDAIIETVSIYTRIQMYGLQTWLGPPDTGMAAFRPEGDVGYSAVYNTAHGVTGLWAALPCPVDLRTYWEAQARITMSVGRGSSDYVPPVQMTRMC